MNENIEKRFLKDTTNHQITILRDDGINRHIRFRAPGTVSMGFDLITWSGHLCYTGDMGTYVFSRIEDMFEFFRTKNPGAPDGPIYINSGYWAEKVLAVDRHGKIREYSEDRFRAAIRDWIDDREITQEIRAAVKEELLDPDFENEMEAREAVDQFEHDKFRFQDFWEVDLQVFTHHYLWCCYALSWGIARYDEVRALEPSTTKEEASIARASESIEKYVADYGPRKLTQAIISRIIEEELAR